MSVGYITHADCQLHDMGSFHPEQPARLAAVDRYLQDTGLLADLTRYDAIEATPEQLTWAHTPEYVTAIFDASPVTGMRQLDPDTSMNPHSLHASKLAAGSGTQAIDLVMNNSHSSVFCNVRPPGHHAEHDKVMGFCLFNSIAVAAHYAINHHGLKRVAILDFDVHHGNGTEDIVSANEQILFCSSFQHPYYPYSSPDPSSPTTVKTPLPEGSDGAMMRGYLETQWLNAISDFKPELILVSAGFDAHQEDPLAGLNWLDEDYAWLAEFIGSLARDHSQGRVVSMLEGGYSLEALARSAQTYIAGLS